jgi:hypothetical protein
MTPPITDDMVIRSCGSLFINLVAVAKGVEERLTALGVTDTSGVLSETHLRLTRLKKDGLLAEAIDPGLGHIYQLTASGLRRKTELEAAALAPA